jgi:RNA polymerase sigma-70 factor (ECF subfamily)
LGDVLYAGTSKTLALEVEWVELVKSVALRDQRALHRLYERAHRMVFTLAVRITHDRGAAEEVTLDVFHDVWRRASAYDAANGTVLGWIMNQARSRAIDRVRFEQRRKRLAPQPQDAAPIEYADDPQQMFALGEQRAALRGALLQLTADERHVIETAYFAGLTHVEVAKRLGQPLGTVKTRIRSGIAKLRKTMGGG